MEKQDKKYRELEKELLTAMRGKRTQGALSRRLGYSYNQVYRWEAGVKRLKWKDLCAVAKATKADLPLALEKSVAFLGDHRRADEILKHLIGNRSAVEVATRLGFTRYALMDWRSGKADPPLEAMLRFLEEEDALLTWLEVLAGEAGLPSRRREIELKRELAQFLADHPASAALLVATELGVYENLSAHRVGMLAKAAGFGIEEEEFYLRELTRLGALEKKNGKFRKSTYMTSTRGDFEAEKRMKAYWIERSVRALRSRERYATSGNFGYLLFASNSEKDAKIREALVEFNSQMARIFAEPGTTDTVKVISLQMFEPGWG